MIRKHGYKRRTEALSEAARLLWESRGEESSRSLFYVGSLKKRGTPPFSYISDEETGAEAFVLRAPGRGGYNLIFLSPDEAGVQNRTYPFRTVPENELPLLVAVRAPIFKPSKEITPSGALTPEGMRAIYTFSGFDCDNDSERADLPFSALSELGAFSLDEAFTIISNRSGEAEIYTLNLRPFPLELTERTGVRIESPADYIRALEALTGEEMSREEAEGAEEDFLFCASDLFLKYASYEFARTENYGHLREILSSSGLFGLPDKWEEGFSPLHPYTDCLGEGDTVENYVIARYLSKWNSDFMLTQKQIKDVAEYTGAPLRLIARASRVAQVGEF